MARPKVNHDSDLVRDYLKEIGRVPLLERDEEVALAQVVYRHRLVEELREELIESSGTAPSMEALAEASGLTEAEIISNQKRYQFCFDKMVKANLRLVVSIAKKYNKVRKNLDFLDLIQEGSIGLQRGVEKFDPTKGYRFSTYAYWWIRQAITRSINTADRSIRLPIHIEEKLAKIRKYSREFFIKNGRRITEEELAAKMKITVEKLREYKETAQQTLSLNVVVGEEQDTELGDLLQYEGISAEQYAEEELRRAQIEFVMVEAELTPKEREVIRLRFGLADGTAHTLEYIGGIYNVSRERARQIQSKGMNKLKGHKRLLRGLL